MTAHETAAAHWGLRTRTYLAHAQTQPEGYEYWAEQARLTAIYAGTCARLALQEQTLGACVEALHGPQPPICESCGAEALSVSPEALCGPCADLMATCEVCWTRISLHDACYVESKRAVHIYCNTCVGEDDPS